MKSAKTGASLPAGMNILTALCEYPTARWNSDRSTSESSSSLLRVKDSENDGCLSFHRFSVDTATPKKSARSASVAPNLHSFAAYASHSGVYLLGLPVFLVVSYLPFAMRHKRHLATLLVRQRHAAVLAAPVGIAPTRRIALEAPAALFGFGAIKSFGVR